MFKKSILLPSHMCVAACTRNIRMYTYETRVYAILIYHGNTSTKNGKDVFAERRSTYPTHILSYHNIYLSSRFVYVSRNMYC